jgi:hypothetical protein
MIQQQTSNHEGQGAATKSDRGSSCTVENQFQTPQAVLQTQKVLPTIVTSPWNYNVGIDHASCLKCTRQTGRLRPARLHFVLPRVVCINLAMIL